MNIAIYFNDQFFLITKEICNKKTLFAFYFKFDRMLPYEFFG